MAYGFNSPHNMKFAISPFSFPSLSLRYSLSAQDGESKHRQVAQVYGTMACNEGLVARGIGLQGQNGGDGPIPLREHFVGSNGWDHKLHRLPAHLRVVLIWPVKASSGLAPSMPIRRSMMGRR